MKLIVETTNFKKFSLLASFLRTNGYKVSIEDNVPLNEEGWVLPGRAANDEEHELHAQAMENDSDEGKEASLFFKELVKEIEGWK
ncbi:MAG: hypothetical protein HY958_01195 [Bacteroidia bacterium]|nr:hypothetical protein [Bacteroidia bacterium]